MSHDTQTKPMRFIAGADLSASSNLYKAVKLGTNGNVTLATVGDKAIGILVLCGASGSAVAVAIMNSTKAVAGGVITASNQLVVGATGALVTTTFTTGQYILGIALESAVLGDVFEMFIEKSR